MNWQFESDIIQVLIFCTAKEESLIRGLLVPHLLEIGERWMETS